MKDFIKKILETSKDRLKNPLVGSFILSWLVFNWKGVLVVLFSSKSIEDRISYVAKEDYSILLLLWLPLLMALFYVVILPYLSLVIEKLNVYAKRIRKETVFKENLEKITQNIELKKKELRLEKAKIDYEKLAEKNKASNEISTEKRDYFKVEFDKFINTSDFKIFELVAAEIRRYKSTPNNITSIAIEKFIALDLVERIDDEDNQNTYYILTEKGNFFWKEIMLSKKINAETAIEKEQQSYPAEDDDLPF